MNTNLKFQIFTAAEVPPQTYGGLDKSNKNWHKEFHGSMAKSLYAVASYLGAAPGFDLIYSDSRKEGLLPNLLKVRWWPAQH